jgi:hypothetical protein
VVVAVKVAPPLTPPSASIDTFAAISAPFPRNVTFASPVTGNPLSELPFGTRRVNDTPRLRLKVPS